MDSFELRTQLTNMLSSLNSSKQSSLDICNFFIRNYVNQEDLYPALIDVLCKVDLNKRLNIFQFIDDFLSLILKDKKLKSNDIVYNYAFLIISDLRKIVELVIPKAELGPALLAVETNDKYPTGVRKPQVRTLANLPFAYTILVHISDIFKFEKLDHYKSQYNSTLITDADLEKISQNIKFDSNSIYYENVEPTKSSHVDDYINNGNTEEHDSKREDDYIPSQIHHGLESAWEFMIFKRKSSQYERLLIDYNDDPFSEKTMHEENGVNDSENTTKTPLLSDSVASSNINNAPLSTKTPSNVTSNIIPTSSNNNLLLSHNAILQRIEADRERQKRGKECLWEIEHENGEIKINEFKYIFDTLNSFDEESDRPIIDEMEKLYHVCTSKVTPISNKQSNNRVSRSNNSQQRSTYQPQKNVQPHRAPNQRYNGNPQDYYNASGSTGKNKRLRPNRNNYNERDTYDVYYGYENDSWKYSASKSQHYGLANSNSSTNYKNKERYNNRKK